MSASSHGLIVAAVLSIGLLVTSPFAQDIGLMLRGFGFSLVSVVIAILLSLLLGLAVSILATSSEHARKAFIPLVELAQSVPVFALLPLLLIHFGSSSVPILIVLILGTIWPILFAIIGSSRSDHHWKIIGPGLLAAVMLAWGQAWEIVIGAEILTNTFGVGHVLGDISAGGSAGSLAFAILVYLLMLTLVNYFIWYPLVRALNSTTPMPSPVPS